MVKKLWQAKTKKITNNEETTLFSKFSVVFYFDSNQKEQVTIPAFLSPFFLNVILPSLPPSYSDLNVLRISP